MRRRAVSEGFRRFAHGVAAVTGTPWAFATALSIVVLWALVGPVFRYSDGWQLSINTGTTIVTFLMVFLIQNTQNRDSQVAQLKLDELIRAVGRARNDLVDLEALTDEELERLHQQFAELRQRSALQRARTSPTASAPGNPKLGDTPNGGRMSNSVKGLVVAIALASASPAQSQVGETTMAFEMRPLAGIFLPTGQLRHDFAAAPLVGFQGGFELSQNAHLVLGGMWVQTDARFPSFTDRRTDIWQFDAAGEYNLVRPLGAAWLFRPYAGAGLGLRTYDYSMATVGTRTCGAGFASFGTELQRRVVAVRFEDRNTLTCFTSPTTAVRRPRFDIGLSLGVVFHLM